MILKDSFFTINNIEKNNEEYFIKIKLNSSHKIFEAHFPGHPIVPGVCILEMLKEIISEIDKCEVIISQVKSMKFLNPIDPTITPDLLFTYKKNNELSVNSSIQTEDKTMMFSKMKLELKYL